MRSPRPIWQHMTNRFRYRVVADRLLVALPMTILIGVLLTRSASSDLTAVTELSSVAEIAQIADGGHTDTNATVMAMEKGAKQMQRGLALLEDVAQSTAQVSLATQQQRSATTQVVEKIDQRTDASRQVSATAQQLAGACASLATLAGNLEHNAAAKDRY